MKILLIGEFSGVHLNLKKGLERLGHQVKVVSSGDSWKKINTDEILTKSKWNKSRLGQLLNVIVPFIKMRKYKNYDVVQLITPSILSLRLNANSIFIKRLKRRNKRLFLIAAGCDSRYYYTVNRVDLFEYSPCESCKEFDLKNNLCKFTTARYIKENKKIERIVDGIIPLSRSYFLSYQHLKNTFDVLPMPIIIDDNDISCIENNTKHEKIVIFHGINRTGFKGTNIIKEALEKIQGKYLDKVEIHINDRMPYNDYMKLLDKTDIVIDQIYSYDSGMNALLAMSKGKIVLGGNEDKFNFPNCPVVNVKPSVQDIVEKLEELINSPNKILDLKIKSMKYVRKYHNYIDVAKKFINYWIE